MNLNHSLSMQDMPKAAIISLLLVSVLVGAHFTLGRINSQRERARTISHMNLEMGRGFDGDTSEVPESRPGDGDPNFVW